MASQFPATKDGAFQLMQKLNLQNQDLVKALDSLKNPMVSSALNRLSPNLTEMLNGAGQDLLKGNNVTGQNPLANQNILNGNNGGNTTTTIITQTPGVQDSLNANSLRERLSKI